MAAAALPAGLILVFGLSACGGGGYKTKTLGFTEKDTNDFGFADAAPKTKVGKQGPERLSAGDVLSFRSLLLDGSGKQAGEINATCAITHGGTFATARGQCQGTATVPGGQLVLNVAGAFASGTTRGAIVGGTGSYKGAGGTFVSVESSRGSKDTFNVQIPQK